MSDCNVISSLLYYYWELSQHQPPMTPLLRRLFIDRSVITQHSTGSHTPSSVLFCSLAMFSSHSIWIVNSQRKSDQRQVHETHRQPHRCRRQSHLNCANSMFDSSIPHLNPSDTNSAPNQVGTYMICSFQSNVGLTISSSTNTANPETQASASARLVSHS